MSPCKLSNTVISFISSFTMDSRSIAPLHNTVIVNVNYCYVNAVFFKLSWWCSGSASDS